MPFPPLKTILVDDEPAALEVLEAHIVRHCPQLEICGKADSALKAIQLIQQQTPDLVFLDIEMPFGNGFEVVEAFPNRDFELVFTTSHEEYALRAIKAHPADYLLKPIDLDDLLPLVEALYKTKEQQWLRKLSQWDKKIEITSARRKLYLDKNDIIRVEADGSYSKIHYFDQHSGSKSITSSRNMKFFEQQLDLPFFFRCHHSHLVNLVHLLALELEDGGYLRMKDNSLVPLSTRKQSAFHKLMAALSQSGDQQ